MVANLFLSWTLPVLVIAYVVTLVRLVSSIRKQDSAYWQSIGNPSLWDPNGQAAILKRVFLPKFFPREIAERHKAGIKVVRFLGLAGLAIFAVVLLLIALGSFEG